MIWPQMLCLVHYIKVSLYYSVEASESRVGSEGIGISSEVQ